MICQKCFLPLVSRGEQSSCLCQTFFYLRVTCQSQTEMRKDQPYSKSLLLIPE